MSSYDYYQRAYKAWLKQKAAMEEADKKFDRVLGISKYVKDPVVEEKEKFKIPEPNIPPHLRYNDLQGLPPVVDEPPQTVFGNLKKTLHELNKQIDSLASTKSTNPHKAYESARNAFGGKSRKQQRKTKARRSHRKRTQRK
jgi:hypothetical protein